MTTASPSRKKSPGAGRRTTPTTSGGPVAWRPYLVRRAQRRAGSSSRRAAGCSSATSTATGACARARCRWANSHDAFAITPHRGSSPWASRRTLTLSPSPIGWGAFRADACGSCGTRSRSMTYFHTTSPRSNSRNASQPCHCMKLHRRPTSSSSGRQWQAPKSLNPRPGVCSSLKPSRAWNLSRPSSSRAPRTTSLRWTLGVRKVWWFA
mmetsp:Transcript_6556/g.21137  ORF Transcript_6556/g.21137 Transcript_6556/m.21137 type:complete len:209 (-) Transcript_6556:858-1484(-)